MQPEFLNNLGDELSQRYQEKLKSWLPASNRYALDVSRYLQLEQEEFAANYQNWIASQFERFDRLSLEISDASVDPGNMALSNPEAEKEVYSDGPFISYSDDLSRTPESNKKSSSTDEHLTNDTFSTRPQEERQIQSSPSTRPESDQPAFTQFKSMKDLGSLISNKKNDLSIDQERQAPVSKPEQKTADVKDNIETPKNQIKGESKVTKEKPINPVKGQAISHHDSPKVFLKSEVFSPEVPDSLTETNSNSTSGDQSQSSLLPPASRNYQQASPLLSRENNELAIPPNRVSETTGEDTSTEKKHHQATPKPQEEHQSWSEIKPELLSPETDVEEIIDELSKRLYEDYKRYYGN